MKKALALLCAAALAAGLTACGGTTSSPAATATPESSATPAPQSGTDASDSLPADSTGDSGDSGDAAAEPDAELSALVDSIYAQYEVPIMTFTNAVDLSDSAWVKQYTGLDDASQLEAAVASESAIGSQAYSLVLVRVAEGADAAQIADQMAAGINPAKWICVMADDVMVGSAGQVAMLVMVDSQLEISAQDVADAFVAAAGEGASCWKPETVGSPQGGISEDGGAALTPAG